MNICLAIGESMPLSLTLPSIFEALVRDEQ